MDSNFLKNYHQRSLQPRQDGDNGSAPGQGLGGLARYRSAPTSYYADFVSRDSTDVDFLCRPSSPETERILERFISHTAERVVQSGNRRGGDGKFPMTMKSEETGEGFAERGSYSSPVSQDMGMEYRVAGGGGTDATRVVPANVGYVPSNLVRHSSSPAGLFDDLNIDGRNVTKFNGTMSPIHEIGKKNMVEVSPSTSSGDHHEVANFGRHSSSGYLTGFPIGSFNDGIMSTGKLFGDRQMGSNDDEDVFSDQIAEEGEEEKHRVRPLAHHLSLPSKSSAIGSFLQMQDSVPCKVRAKRGCATHPRSIAERVRRTKISERIRKLQDLVPNMDKQTNTADMLDLAVDYIKDLQGQVKTLSDSHARCTCSNIKFL